MSDDLVRRLRIGVGDAVRDHHLMREAADRIEALTAERDALAAQVVENENLLSQCEDWLERADKSRLAAIAERDTLAEKLAEAVVALHIIDALDPEEHINGCSSDALRGLVLRMGEAARAALAKLETKA